MDVTNRPRCFAVVCAAGRSARMGVSKLMLPWQGRPLIAHVLEACLASKVARTVVVTRTADEPLFAECQRWDVDLVFNDLPNADMRSSVQIALDWLAATYSPSDRDAWLLVPGDVPGIAAATIDQLFVYHDTTAPTIVVPVAGGRRGHPTLLPWSLAIAVPALPADEGVDALVRRGPVREVNVGDIAILFDVDTPEDYERLMRIGQ